MRCRNNKGNMLLKVLSVLILIASIFSVVWLRSSVVSIEYSLGKLENTKIAMLKERKLLAAERASLLSVERLGKVAAKTYVFPDRVRVVYVKKDAAQDMRKTAASVQPGHEGRGNLLGMVRN
ncbi:MAG: hypothetical protein RBT37_01445 [Dissulfurispiraceae bacterium]|jgi:hypothetical protein|nr:hypothetical protein [Dissulfurispiraceae bacterium]